MDKFRIPVGIWKLEIVRVYRVAGGFNLWVSESRCGRNGLIAQSLSNSK